MEVKGPFCQSCAMPMLQPSDFGTDENGFRVNDYCYHCFENGKFTNENITAEEMINISAKYMGIPEEQARKILSEFIPKLKRWNV